jgi:hypothetical protein
MKTCADCGADSLHDLCYNCESLLLEPKQDDYNNGYADGMQGEFDNDCHENSAYRNGWTKGMQERNAKHETRQDRLRDWAAAEAEYSQEWPEDYRF